MAGAYDVDDFAGYGMLGLIRAIHTYDENGKANFKTYASRCIKNAIVDAVRKSESGAVEIKLDSVDDEIQGEMQQTNPESIFIENETSALLFEAISSLLTPTELDVLKLHLECMSYADIAKELGLERKKVDNTIYSAKKKSANFLTKRTINRKSCSARFVIMQKIRPLLWAAVLFFALLLQLICFGFQLFGS